MKTFYHNRSRYPGSDFEELPGGGTITFLREENFFSFEGKEILAIRATNQITGEVPYNVHSIIVPGYVVEKGVNEVKVEEIPKNKTLRSSIIELLRAEGLEGEVNFW